jgi:hypothetical protein
MHVPSYLLCPSCSLAISADKFLSCLSLTITTWDRPRPFFPLTGNQAKADKLFNGWSPIIELRLRFTGDRCYDFINILAFFDQTTASCFCKNVIITLVFEKNAYFFADNCPQTHKVVIITSTPVLLLPTLFCRYFSHMNYTVEWLGNLNFTSSCARMFGNRT